MLEDLAERFSEDVWIYVSMPFVAALIGYVTKLVAIRMMFSPVEFVGIKPFFGWQGIIPKRAARMATIAVDTMTSRLISTREIVARLDPERLAAEIEVPMLQSVDDIAREVMAEYQPGLWDSLPEPARGLIVRRVKSDAPAAVRAIVADLRDNIEDVFDLKHMVVVHLVRDKRLLNRMFADVGAREFRFIARSGLVFGFGLGLVQMTVWLFYQAAWILPAFGLFVGYATDWVALKMLFHPKEPRRILGVTWQGLFLKRQQEVARDYAELIAAEVLTPAHVFEALLQGPFSDRLFHVVQKHIQTVVDSQMGPARPLVVFAVGSAEYRQMKRAVTERLVARLPETLQHAASYATDAMDIRATLVTKMQALTPREFEGILRPAFQADEWILITVGALLGAAVGELQTFLLLH
ncbi:MAG: DUF445 domain-containing protein [Acidimicrobiia bacterium]